MFHARLPSLLDNKNEKETCSRSTFCVSVSEAEKIVLNVDSMIFEGFSDSPEVIHKTCSTVNGYLSPDIFLKLTMVRRKSGCPDPRLQRQLRRQLRLLENDSREVMAVFSVSQMLGNCFIYSENTPCATEIPCEIFGSHFHLHAVCLNLSDQSFPWPKTI